MRAKPLANGEGKRCNECNAYQRPFVLEKPHLRRVTLYLADDVNDI